MPFIDAPVSGGKKPPQFQSGADAVRCFLCDLTQLFTATGSVLHLSQAISQRAALNHYVEYVNGCH